MKEWLKNSTLFEKFCAVAFVFLATLSCLATAQSLTLTLGVEFLPFWVTLVFAFILSVFVYTLTAFCFKLMIDSCNDKYCASIHKTISDRKVMYWSGLLGVLFFWVICSLPTNTHSMLHMKVTKEVALAELDNQLQIFKKATITDKNSLYNEFYRDSVEMRRYITQIKGDLDFEVNRSDDEGFGPRAKRIVEKVQSHYKNEIVKINFIFEDPRANGQAMNDDQLLDFYKTQLDNLSNQLVSDRHAEYIVRLNSLDTETADINKKIADIERTIAFLKKKGNNIGNAKEVIDDGYNQLSYKEQILNNVEELKDPSKGHDPNNVKKYNIYRIDRLYSVFNVWSDFFSGKLPKEFDMLYWIMWAAILDIAALIFSGIAFKGKVNNNQAKQIVTY